MDISYKDALKAQKAIEDKLLLDPTVVSIGVVEEIDRYGRKSGDYSIKVGVISSDVYQNALAHGESIIPREFTVTSENGNHDIKPVQIKVVKTGQINTLYSKHSNTHDLPSAIDDIPPADLQSSDDCTSKQRPCLCGQSIGHSNVTAGALGLIVEYTHGANIGKANILSNNHVLAAVNAGFVGDAITCSCLFERESKKPVGRLFAGHESETFHNPIKTALRALSMSWVNRYPSGKTHHFKKDYPLNILKRNYSTLQNSSFYHFTKLSFRSSIQSSTNLMRRVSVVISLGIFASNRIYDSRKTIKNLVIRTSPSKRK